MQDYDIEYNTDENLALEWDEQDNLKFLGSQFFMPVTHDGIRKIYFSGNSLTLEPKTTPESMRHELARWQELVVVWHGR